MDAASLICGRCSTGLTPENATVCPEYFLCDECAVKLGLTDKPQKLRTLDEIAIHFQTDRASVFTRTYAKPHDYARHYDAAFSQFRDKPIRLIEIGVGGGEGVLMWLEYFRSGKVYGVDITQNTNSLNTPDRNGRMGGRYFFNCGDQSDETFWRCWLADHGGDLDIVIDDGSHISEHILTTFHLLWPFVKSGGFYSIEDLSVAPVAMNQLQRLAKENDGTIDSMYFAKELCIIRKA